MSSLSDPQLETALSIYTAALPRQARLIQLAGEVLRQLAVVKAGLPPVQESENKQVEDKLAAGQPILAQVPIPASHLSRFPEPVAGTLSGIRITAAAVLIELRQIILTLPPHVWLREDF